MKRRDDMKKAFERLQVQKPLKLPSEGPGFVAPKSPTVQSEVPQSGAPLFQQADNEHADFEQANSRVAQNEGSRNETSSGTFSGEVLEGTQNEVAQGKGPSKTRVHAKKEAPHNDATDNEPPLGEEPQNKVPSGNAFFRLSPRVFSESVTRNMSGDCFRLFLWLSWRAWRFPDSAGVVRAAVSFIEAETGMGHATVSRCLKLLKESGLVTLVETNFKRGNVWRVSALACPDSFPDPSGGKLPRKKSPQNEVAPSSKSGDHHLKMSARSPQTEEHIKNYKNTKTNLSGELEILHERLNAIEAPQKRTRETQSLQLLLKNYAPEKILTALQFVEKHGTLRGEACHSPYAYLALAADDVLKRIQARPVVAVHEISVHMPKNVSPSDNREAIATFERSLSPIERSQYLEKFIATEFPHGFCPPKRVTESMAASAWFASRERSSLSLAV